MSLEAYEILNAVLSTGNFSAAAARLNLTPSAVSHSISATEARFGIRLFTRGSRSVEPTPVCLELADSIRDILRCEERLQQQADLLTGSESGQVSLGCFSSVCTNWMPSILRDFRRLHPGIRVNLQQGGYDDILSWIRQRSVDIAFVSGSIVGNDDSSVELHRDRFVCAAPYDFVPANGRSFTADDLQSLPLIAQRGENNLETEKLLEKLQAHAASDYAIEDDRSLVAMAEAGLGCCLLEELVVRNMHAQISIWPLEPVFTRSIRLKLTEPAYAPPAARTLYHFIIEYLQKHRELLP